MSQHAGTAGELLELLLDELLKELKELGLLRDWLLGDWLLGLLSELELLLSD
jgi:hypothetical protein